MRPPFVPAINLFGGVPRWGGGGSVTTQMDSDGNFGWNLFSCDRPSEFERSWCKGLRIFDMVMGGLNYLHDRYGERPSYPPVAYNGPESGYPNSAFGNGPVNGNYRDSYYPTQGYNNNGIFSLGALNTLNDYNTSGITWPSMALPSLSMPWQMPWAQPQVGGPTAGNPPAQNGLREQTSPDKVNNDTKVVTFDKAYADQQGNPVRLETYQKFQTVAIMTGRTEFHAPDANGETGKEQRRSALLGTQYREGEVVEERNHKLYKTYTLNGKKIEEFKQDGKIIQVTIDDKGNKSQPTASPETLRAEDAKENWVDLDSNGKLVTTGSTTTTTGSTSTTTTSSTTTTGSTSTTTSTSTPTTGSTSTTTATTAPTADESDVARLVKLQIQYDNLNAKHGDTRDLAKQLGELKNKLGVLQSDKGNEHLGKVTDPKYARLVEIAKLQGLYDRVTHLDPKKDSKTYDYWNYAPVTGKDGKVIPGLTHRQDLANKLGYLKSQAAETVEEPLNAVPQKPEVKTTQNTSVLLQTAQKLDPKDAKFWDKYYYLYLDNKTGDGQPRIAQSQNPEDIKKQYYKVSQALSKMYNTSDNFVKDAIDRWSYGLEHDVDENASAGLVAEREKLAAAYKSITNQDIV